MQTCNLHKLSTAKLKALILFSISFACNADQQLNQVIQQQAQAYVEQNIRVDNEANVSISVAPIDSRITIEPCPQMYGYNASESSLRQQNISVKVTCPSSGWYLFTNVQVIQTKAVAVAADMLSPGALLTKENMQLVDTPINRLRTSTYSFLEDLTGARLKRRVRPGQIITASMLCFVCKGDRIVIAASGSGLSLKTSGIAQQDGNVGDTIRVRNIGSQKLVSAVVADSNQVNVAF